MLKTPLEDLKESMKSFKLGRFDIDNLKESMTGILATNLLSEAKRRALSDFKNSPMILQEMADVLNMQIDALESGLGETNPFLWRCDGMKRVCKPCFCTSLA